MPSDTQITANRENGKLGGVKSETGKAISRFNARKHGICGQLPTEYEGNVYKHFLDQLFAEKDPQMWEEEMLVERIAICYLQLYRAAKAEKEYMRGRLEPPEMDSVLDSMKFAGGYRPALTVGDIGTLERFLRYTATIENRMYKAMHELERIKRRRKGEVVAAPVAVDIGHEVGFVSQK